MQKRRLLQGFREPPDTPGRKIRNSIQLSEKGTVIDIITTEVYEEVEAMGNGNKIEGRGGGKKQEGYDMLVIDRDDDDKSVDVDNNNNDDDSVNDNDEVGERKESGGGRGVGLGLTSGGRNVVIHGGTCGAGLGAR